jgi:hypothetical protein
VLQQRGCAIGKGALLMETQRGSCHSLSLS